MTNAWEIPTKNSDVKMSEIITPAWLSIQVPDWRVSNQKHLIEASLDCALFSRTQTHKGQSGWNDCHTDTCTHDLNNGSILYSFSLPSLLAWEHSPPFLNSSISWFCPMQTYWATRKIGDELIYGITFSHHGTSPEHKLAGQQMRPAW